MNYPNIFKYIFYRIYLYYGSKRDAIPKFSSIVVLTVVQNLNFLTFVSPFISNINITVLKISSLVLSLILFFVNYFFIIKNFDYIKSKWENENIKEKKRRGFLVTIYIIGSIILCFGLVGYLGLLHIR